MALALAFARALCGGRVHQGGAHFAHRRGPTSALAFALFSLFALTWFAAGCAAPTTTIDEAPGPTLGKKSKKSPPSDEDNGTGSYCLPGQARVCKGDDGCKGHQLCLDDGSDFDVCDCNSDGQGNDPQGGGGGSQNTGGSNSTGGSKSGVGGSAGGSPTAPGDPCQGVPVSGMCSSQTTVTRCSISTDNGKTQIVTQTCAPYETCVMNGGMAACAPKPGACTPGATKCASPSTKNECLDSGTWAERPCLGCTDSPGGALCPGTSSTGMYSGTVAYEVRGPTQDLSAWQDVGTAPGAGVYVVSGRFTQAESTVYDAAIAGPDGSFSVKVPLSPSPDDAIVVYALRLSADGQTVVYAVAQPGVPDGTWPTQTPVPAESSQFWGWSFPMQQLGPSGGTLTVTQPMGSAALRIFYNLHRAFDRTAELTGQPGMSIVIWFRYNSEWDCGACQAGEPASVQNSNFASQIWAPGNTQDESYWSDAVMSHELGHWVMNSYSTPPYEGGAHTIGCPTFPG